MTEGQSNMLRIERSDEADTATLCLHGEIDLSSANVLSQAIDEAIDAGWRRVVIDFSDLEFVNSSGLGVLVAATKRLRAEGGDLVARRLHGIPASALELTGLDQFLTIED